MRLLFSSYRSNLPTQLLDTVMLDESWSFLDHEDDVAMELSLLFKSGVFTSILAPRRPGSSSRGDNALSLNQERVPAVFHLTQSPERWPDHLSRARLAVANRSWYDRHLAIERQLATIGSGIAN